jgi:Flp pilus assembly protein TadD
MRQLHQALELEQHGNPQGAMSIVNQLLEANPHFVPALKLKGMLLSDAGEESAAGPVFVEALGLAPNDSDLLLETGIYRLTTGDKAEAIRLLEHCIWPARSFVPASLATLADPLVQRQGSCRAASDGKRW